MVGILKFKCFKFEPSSIWVGIYEIKLIFYPNIIYEIIIIRIRIIFNLWTYIILSCQLSHSYVKIDIFRNDIFTCKYFKKIFRRSSCSYNNFIRSVKAINIVIFTTNLVWNMQLVANWISINYWIHTNSTELWICCTIEWYSNIICWENIKSV